MNVLRKSGNSSLLICIVICLTLCGCEFQTGNAGVSDYVNQLNAQNDVAPVSKSGIYFDTIITITLYGNDKEKHIDKCFEIADKYEAMFSKSIETSDIARVNNSDGSFVKVSDETMEILKFSQKYSKLSEGKFSLVCGALTSLWDIGGNNSDNAIPSDEEIKAALQLCGDDNIEINYPENEIRILQPGVKLDFGAAAKGYIADKMKEYLVSEGVESGVISLGGNILLIGNKPVYNNNHNAADNKYSIGIAKPFTKNNEMITTLHLTDTSVVTSGNYQRYFEKDGKLYHHIIDLTTGYPADTSLNSVTIICPSSLEADILSTTCYLSGYEKGTRLCESLSIDSIFISSDNEIIYNSFAE